MTTIIQNPSFENLSHSIKLSSSGNVDKVVQSVTNATKRLSQISTNTNSSNKYRKSQNRIGPWKLGRTLGRGSTGRVRLAKNINNGKLAAVKIVPKSNFKKLENPKYKNANPNSNENSLPYGIEREIVIMKLISHPNIMGLYDVWENKNDLYLILEYIEGGELFDYLIKRGKLQEFEAINYFKQIINGINYLHQFNICHRDLKPENLLLDHNKNIKIADFGMAALEIKEKLLETSCGSPHYASPEIVAGKNYHGAPSDIWSCGIILFALLTGHLPFDDENIRKLLLKVQSGKFIMPHDLSWEAKDLITKMLQVNPNDRISIRDILKHPLLTKYPEPILINNNNAKFNLNDLQKSNFRPIESVDKIDKEILKNLSILFHNCHENHIINRLLDTKMNSEKMFYYLLMKYRNDHNNKNNYEDDLTLELNTSDSKQTLPRSTSIIKTTLVDQVTGETKTSIKVEKLPPLPATSKLSNSHSKKPPAEVLANITNKPKVFKASTSFSKKKIYLNNNNISRTSSSKSIKVNKPPQQHPPKFLNKENGIPNDSKTLQNFEQVCLDMFENSSPKPMTTIEKIKQYDSQFKLKPKLPDRTVESHKLPSKVQLPARSYNLPAKSNQVLTHKDSRDLLKPSSRRPSNNLVDERRRQSLILQAKQREALEKLKQFENHEGSATAKLNQRFISSPNPSTNSSLDPRAAAVNSLFRAKSLATPSSYASLRSMQSLPKINEKNSLVLQKLGIDIKPNAPKIHSNLKTSSSRNLSNYLSDSEPQPGDHIDKENLSIHNYNKVERKSRQPSSSALKPVNSNLVFNSMNNIDHKTDKELEMEEADDILLGDLTQMTVENLKQNLIPNPRFSKFSFNGLLNKLDDPDVTIMNSTLTYGGTVVRRNKNNKQLVIPENDTINTNKSMLKKSSTTNLLGLGINVSKDESKISNQFVSVNVSTTRDEDNYSISNSTFNKNVINDGEYEVSSDSTILDEDYNLSDNLVNMDQNHGSIMEDYSNFSIISSRTADVVAINKTRPSIIEHLDSSKETLHNDNELRSMFKNYQKLYEPKESTVIREQGIEQLQDDDIDADADEELEEADITERISESTILVKDESFQGNQDTSNIHILDNTSIVENTQNDVNNDSPFDFNDSGDFDQATEATEATQATEEENINRVGSIRKSRASTEIGRMVKQGEAKNETRRVSKAVTINSQPTESQPRRQSKGNGIISSPIEDAPPRNPNRGSILRRLSLKPKREAPKAPDSSSWDYGVSNKTDNNRLSFGSKFNRLSSSYKSKNSPIVDSSESTPKNNWFKRFFNNFTSSSIRSPILNANEKRKSFGKSKDQVSDSNNTLVNKDLFIIESDLTSVDLTRIIKNQLELKKIEGSVSKVEIDEEFGLISGVIPSKFASGRKLKFKIEIIDLVNTSSLHLNKLKGSDKGFNNLINVVEFIIKQEETNTTQKKSNGYTFSGYQT